MKKCEKRNLFQMGLIRSSTGTCPAPSPSLRPVGKPKSTQLTEQNQVECMKSKVYRANIQRVLDKALKLEINKKSPVMRKFNREKLIDRKSSLGFFISNICKGICSRPKSNKIWSWNASKTKSPKNLFKVRTKAMMPKSRPSLSFTPMAKRISLYILEKRQEL